MALSNRDRIGQMLDVLAPALQHFIASVIDPELQDGQSWVSLVAARDLKKGIEGKTYEPEDVQVQLRMLTENIPHQVRGGWYPFDGKLSRVHQSYASELRDVRNDWAHSKAFTNDDAYRALDTAERLLTAIGAGARATAVGQIRTNLRRVSAEQDDKRTLKRAASENPAAEGLRPWREVLAPHRDVASGNFKASEFAADLYKVASGEEGGRDYAHPVEFFQRTYLTEGLKDLIGAAVDRLTGDANASPVINLQTNFGGGKTHSMLSLWHLAGGTPLGDYPQDVQELLSAHGFGKLAGRTINKVAIVGNHFAPTGELKPDGTFVRTIWGELAWQLGGAEGYAMVADADRASTPPGAALHQLLAAHAPAVILIDEWVAYARGLYGVAPDDDRVTGGTFENQFGFAQSLTEAAKGTPGIVLAISIPASDTGAAAAEDAEPAGHLEEVGGSHGMEALKRLQNVVRRVAEPWRPASSAEAYNIVRQRLFTTPDAEALASIRATARAFADFYNTNSADFPKESGSPDYERRIRETYPVHPELFDRLYEDWSSLERFQRTRGVLRLMNAVVHALWTGEDAGPLILPGSLPLSTHGVNTEISQYLQDSWKAVIDTDVDGPQSEPAKIDAQRPQFGGRSLTKRLARTVFFGSVPTIGSAHKGIETARVFLGTAVPGDRTGDFHAALNALGDRATYYYSGQGKHWYDLRANITRSAKDQAERLHPEDVWAEITRLLKGQSGARGSFARLHVCPASDADIPDIDEARLVVLHPKYAHRSRRGVAPASPAVDEARRILERRGTGNRAHRNMLAFAAADANRLEELEMAVRDYLGWSHVLSGSDLDLTDNQKAQAKERLQRAKDTMDRRLANTYQWVLHPRQADPRQPWTIAESKADAAQGGLAERVSARLSTDGDLASTHSQSAVRMALNRVPALWDSGHVSLGKLWESYANYPYMQRLTGAQVLLDGVARSSTLAFDRDGLALAEAWDEVQSRYIGLWLPTDADTVHPTKEWLVVKPDLALAQREADEEAERRRRETAEPGTEGAGTATPSDRESTGSVGAASAGGGMTGPGQPPAPTAPTVPEGPRFSRYFGSTVLNTASYTLDFSQLASEVIDNLQRAGAKVTIRVEIEAEHADGMDERTRRTVSENAATLKFTETGFEEK
ncbi:Swt1 family HEPN domain-containing protein [Citricoccus zhacaiensis]